MTGRRDAYVNARVCTSHLSPPNGDAEVKPDERIVAEVIAVGGPVGRQRRSFGLLSRPSGPGARVQLSEPSVTGTHTRGVVTGTLPLPTWRCGGSLAFGLCCLGRLERGSRAAPDLGYV